jgi:NADPH2:quinone reductase
MKAIHMTQTGEAGDALRLVDVAEPEITQATQIKVALHAAGVNPIDTKLRRGGLLFDRALPTILGCDGTGTVVATGAAVTKFKSGDRVWFCNGGLGSDPGNYAQYTVLDQRWAAPMPITLDFEHAAAGPLVLITAWGALYERARLQSAHTVLIHAGAGGVGHVAIQLAKLRGAKVFTTVGNEQNAGFVRALGADEIINYTQQDFVAVVNELTGGEGVDVVLESIGHEVFNRSIECTRQFGDIVTLLDFDTAALKEARMRNLRLGFELMLTPQLRKLDTARDQQVDILNHCARLIDNGQLRLHVSQILPMDQAASAHCQQETGHTIGKIVLKI